MQQVTVELTNIPKHIQKRYNIGPTAKAEADNSVGGGHFTITNKKGHGVSVDAVELSGTNIMIRELQNNPRRRRRSRC